MFMSIDEHSNSTMQLSTDSGTLSTSHSQHTLHIHLFIIITIITFHVKCSQGEMYIGQGRLCVCLSLATFPHYCTDLDVTWGNGSRCPLVVHCWADLQLVHGFCCYDNIALNKKCQRLLILALCLVIICAVKGGTLIFRHLNWLASNFYLIPVTYYLHVLLYIPCHKVQFSSVQYTLKYIS